MYFRDEKYRYRSGKYVEDSTRGRSILAPKNYKGDMLLQGWVDSREIALISEYIDQNVERTRHLSDVLKWMAKTVAERLVAEGFEMKSFSESRRILEEKYDAQLNPQGRGLKNLRHNMALESLREEEYAKVSRQWNSANYGASNKNIEPPSDEEIEETIKVVAITDTLMAAGVRIPELSKRERESMRIAVMTDRMEIFFSEALGFSKEDSHKMAEETRERIKVMIENFKSSKNSGNEAASDSLHSSPNSASTPQAESSDSAFPAEELNPTFQAKHLDSNSKAANSAPTSTAGDNISIICEGMTEEEANQRQAEKDKKYEAELKAAMEAMRAKAR